VSLERTGRLFPRDVMFGNLEPNLLQVRRPAEIYRLCREIIAAGRKAPGGFVLAPGCSIPAFAPPASVYAMTRAARDYGRP
jgi:uroporphyrinogen decarboxylase